MRICDLSAAFLKDPEKFVAAFLAALPLDQRDDTFVDTLAAMMDLTNAYLFGVDKEDQRLFDTKRRRLIGERMRDAIRWRLDLIEGSTSSSRVQWLETPAGGIVRATSLH